MIQWVRDAMHSYERATALCVLTDVSKQLTSILAS